MLKENAMALIFQWVWNIGLRKWINWNKNLSLNHILWSIPNGFRNIKTFQWEIQQGMLMMITETVRSELSVDHACVCVSLSVGVWERDWEERCNRDKRQGYIMHKCDFSEQKPCFDAYR